MVQFVLLVCYVQMIRADGFYLFDGFMYGGVINYENAVLLYELILLFSGLKDGYNAIHRNYTNNNMYSYRNE